ncbi:hypothetical protein BN1356_00863 [Streptococcus varani]|uniref:Wzy n=1 Tax=Streptococcus varani TaxID=1608583 RepID=A0A0E4H3J4_9STRE|nr:EpsG family protein [Streptococcus varani]CQR24516.1 hypothetical protein BN1356_00863 [Streptococcus varani]
MKIRVRLSSLIALPLIAFQYILFSFNTANADMLQYIMRYKNILRLGPRYFENLVDIGFNYLIFYIQILRVDYQGFLIILGILIFFLLIQLCHFYEGSYWIFFSSFILSFFFIEAVIVRQFLSSSILAVAFIFIAKKPTTTNKIKSIGLISLAFSMHVSSFLGYFYYIAEKIELRKLYLAAAVGMTVSFPLTNVVLPFLTRLLGAKFALYTNSTNNSFVSFIAKVVFVVVTVFLFQLIYSYVLENKHFFSTKQIKLAELSLKSTLVNGLFIPLMAINISFERLLIVPVFIYLATIAFFFENKSPMTNNKLFIFFTVLAWLALSYRIFVWSDSAGTTIPILNHNLLWSE